jgi:polar amino acid transport system substrate-binding protein
MIQKVVCKFTWRMIFFALIPVLFSPYGADAQEKVILTTHNLYPYGSYPDNVKAHKIVADETFTGVAVDRVRCVFEKMGVPVEIQVYPWERAQRHVTMGLADGFFAASQKDTRDQCCVMTLEIADQRWNWYLLKDNPLNPMDDSFKDTASVGGFLGANMLTWMQENDYRVEAKPKDTEGLLKMLLENRVDAVMANNFVMDALLEKYGAADKVKVYLNQNKPLYVYVSKKFISSRPGFIERFNNLLPDCVR